MTVVIVGNPKPQSRTRRAAELITERLTGHPPEAVIDVIDLGAGLLGWGDPTVAEAVETVKSAATLVVASPTFKASYSGLLKLFLDQFGGGSLRGATAFAVMTGGGPRHTLAAELLLKPVLVEIGCSCPAPALYLVEADLTGGAEPGAGSLQVDSADLTAWLEIARPFVPTG